MKKIRIPLPAAFAVLLALATTGAASPQSPESVKSARTLLAQSASSIVNIGAIVHVDAGMMGPRDDDISTVGMVVDSSGLTVVSRSALNPSGYEPVTFEAGPGMEITIEAELTSVWLQLANGERVDAEVVLSDPDLDLSFIRPVKDVRSEGQLFKAIDWKGKARESAVLDTTIVLSRLGKDDGWAPTVRLERIVAILDTPWKGLTLDAHAGDAVFTDDGGLLGIVVTAPASDGAQSAPPRMMGGPGAKGTNVVLAAAQFGPLIEQALAVPSDGLPKPRKRAPKADPGLDLGNLPKPIAVGAEAPGFSLADESGKTHSLEDYRGKYVLLDWWGMW